MLRLKKMVRKISGLTSSKKQSTPFSNSEDYWIHRYDRGGNSGGGSYNQLADFKAQVINEFVDQHGVGSVMEFGCGDGNQLQLGEYPSYVGFDVSPKAVAMCQQTFDSDSTKTFKLLGDYDGETAELTLSLDVIYHLVEDEVFADYMNRLFDSSSTWVIVYSSNDASYDKDQAAHVRHRNFTDWVEANKPAWRLQKHIPNKYPFKGDNKTGSFADFFIYGPA